MKLAPPPLVSLAVALVLAHSGPALADGAEAEVTADNLQSELQFAGGKKKLSAAQQTSVDDAQTAFMGILEGILPVVKNSGSSKFMVKSCTRWDPSELVGFFLQGKSIQRNFKFKEFCDIEGPLTASTQRPFPLDLAIRHLDPFNRVKMRVRLEKRLEITEGAAVLKIIAENGTLSSPKSGRVDFSADYTILYRIGQQKVDNSRGGTFRATAVNGQPVQFEREIVVDKKSEEAKF